MFVKYSLLLLLVLLLNSGLTQVVPKNHYIHKKPSFLKNEMISDTLYDNYDVKNYRIRLNVQPDDREITGKTTIVFSTLEDNFNQLILNFDFNSIDSVFHGLLKTNYTNQSDLLTVDLKDTLNTGIMDSITIFYHGKPKKGIYFRINKYGNPVIYSHNEPFDARFWFPCKDIPADKALLDMWIEIPQNFKVLSNGILVDEKIVNSELIQYHWQETYPISTYLISIAASPFEIVSETFIWQNYDLPVEYYVYPQDNNRGVSAINNTIEMLEFFSNYIGEYPFIREKYAMSETPFQEAGAMENQTATTMGDFIMDDESIIAHELAHQWWGDALSPDSFKDIWLNEGFATYFDALFFEYKYGTDVFNERMRSSGSRVMSDGSVNYPIYDPPENLYFGSAVYHKGAWVLHMLRNKLGDSVFENIIRTYYNNYNYSNVTTLDFINICEQISGINLQTFFSQWVYSAGVPRLFATWNQTNEWINITLEQLQKETIYDLQIEILLSGIQKDTLINLQVASVKNEYQVQFSEAITSLVIDPFNKILNQNNSPVYLIPDTPELIRIFPNPFNDELNINYGLNRYQHVKIEIWNILGEKIITVFEGKKQTGVHKFVWPVTNLSSGQFFCVLRSEDGIDTKKILLIK